MEYAVELRAGLMSLQGKALHADPRKGLIRIGQDEHGLIHFQWAERGTEGLLEPEMDVIVFPGEATFESIPHPTSRVFILKFPAESTRNVFFWAQGPDAAQDPQAIAAVNAAINLEQPPDEEMEDSQAIAPEAVETLLQQATSAPPLTATNPSPVGGAAAGGAIDSGALAAALGITSSAPGGAGSSIAASQLAAVLGNIMSGAAGAAAPSQAPPIEKGPSLREVLKPEKVLSLLEDPAVVDRLAQHLPEEQRSVQAIRTVINSPQFKSQLDGIAQAFNTGMVDAAHFGLREHAYGVAGFLRALQNQVNAEKAAGGGGGGDNAEEKKEGTD